MRDVIAIPLSGDNLIIASDNSGGIGMKEHDQVQVPYETVAYYSLRVAAMECIAAGGEPVSVVLHNFCGNEPWEDLVKGIGKGLLELGLEGVPITGSTESNFPLLQSAIGVVVVGNRPAGKIIEIPHSGWLHLAVIGLPLVGNEVIEQEERVVPLAVFQEVSKLDGVITWPVGSKGIFYELQQMFPDLELKGEMIDTEVDILKSSGPATCFVAAYHEEKSEKLRKVAGGFFHFLKIK